MMRTLRLYFIMLIFLAAKTKWLHFLKIAGSRYLYSRLFSKKIERMLWWLLQWIIDPWQYIQILSRGGLKIPSTNLVNYICTALAILEFVDDLITKSGLPVGKAEEHVLIYCFQSFKTFASTTHEAIARKITISTAVNVYFKNKRKICTDSVATDGVKTLQKRQREKSPY